MRPFLGVIVDPKELLKSYRSHAERCFVCQSAGLVHCENGRWAKPLFHEEGSPRSGLLLVLEAPNFADTYDSDKGRMTCDPDTDPSGQFLLELLAHVGLTPKDVLLTNAVLCLPAKRNGKHPVKAAQRKLCRPWLERLIVDSDTHVVAAVGDKALQALHAVSPHNLRLRASVGQAHDWFGRKLVPLYHVSRLGRVNRAAELQLRDIECVRPYLRST